MKLPIILGSIGTWAAFALEHTSKVAGALAGVLTCVYLILQIIYKMRHERLARKRRRRIQYDD